MFSLQPQLGVITHHQSRKPTAEVDIIEATGSSSLLASSCYQFATILSFAIICIFNYGVNHCYVISCITIMTMCSCNDRWPLAVCVHRDQDQIRHRFLNPLGIKSNAMSSSLFLTNAKNEVVRENRSGPRKKPRKHAETTHHCSACSAGLAYQEPVADVDSSDSDTDIVDYGACSSCGGESTDDAKQKNKKIQHAVRFEPMVAVYTIPSFRDYPQEIREALWMGTSEIHENAERNRVEFMADGCDYQKATEERGMMWWQGERVHPATYWILYEEEQRRQVMWDASASSSRTIGHPGYSSSIPIKRSATSPSLVGLAA